MLASCNLAKFLQFLSMLGVPWVNDKTRRDWPLIMYFYFSIFCSWW